MCIERTIFLDCFILNGFILFVPLLKFCRRQLCAAYCLIAELYLTAICDEPDAESSCEAVLTSALAIDNASSRDDHCEGGNSDGSHLGSPPPHVLQTMANFRLSQSRVPEALECILKAYNRMKVGYEAMLTLVGLVNIDSGEKGCVKQLEAKSRKLVDVDAVSLLPEYHFPSKYHVRMRIADKKW